MKLIPIIYPYKIGSQSAKKLAETLDTKRVKQKGKYKYKNAHLIINWGASIKPNWAKDNIKILNHWDNIAISHNKLTSLNKMKANGVNTVEFTESKDEAKKWIDQGNVVMCRQKLMANSGYGIVVAENKDELVDAPLYTKYVKGGEFRIHIIKNGNEYFIFDVQKKRKKNEFEKEISSYIKSHRLGFVFCRDNVEINETIKNEAIKAIKALNLDFGAVDLRYSKKKNKAFILECNSSPNCEETTLKNYTNELLNLCNNYA